MRETREREKSESKQRLFDKDGREGCVCVVCEREEPEGRGE